MHARSLAVLLLLAVAFAPAVLAETHPFSVHDMLAMDRISDPQVSPDGRTVAFVVRTTDLDANRGRTDLWLVGADGTGLRRLTAHPRRSQPTRPIGVPESHSHGPTPTRGVPGRLPTFAVRPRCSHAPPSPHGASAPTPRPPRR